MRGTISIPSGRALGLALRGTTDTGSVTGIGINFEDRGDGTGRVVLITTPSSVAYNQEGRTDSWSHISGWVTGTTKTIRVDLRGGVLTVFVNDTRILEVTYSAAQMASFTGTNLHVWASHPSTSSIDNLEVLTP